MESKETILNRGLKTVFVFLITYAGSSLIEMWPLTRAIQDSLQLPHTHDRSVSLVLYNSQMNQVVSICLEPVLKVIVTVYALLLPVCCVRKPKLNELY